LLEDDNSPSDRIIIDGGNASGNTFLQINNTDGLGALTTGNGILVVGTIRVSHEHVTSLLKFLVQFVEHQIRKDRGKRPALRRTFLRHHHHAILQHTGIQVCTDEFD